MKRPNITPGDWQLEAGRCIKTESGDFNLAYGTEKSTGIPRFRSPTELDRIAQAIAALPDLLAALENLHRLASIQLNQGANMDGLTNCEALAASRSALTKAGYTF